MPNIYKYWPKWWNFAKSGHTKTSHHKIEGFLELCSKSLKTCLKLNENTVFEHLWRYAFLKLCLFETKENLNLSFESAGLITFEKTYFILDTLAHYITCMYLNFQ